MSYDSSLQMAQAAARRKRPSLGLLLLLITAVLLLVMIGCSDRTSSGSSSDSTAADTAAAPATGASPASVDFDKLPKAGNLPAAGDALAADSIPLRAPDGGLARFGIESGRIVQVYSGGRRGYRVLLFDKYGMREYRLDSSLTHPTGSPGPFQNSIFVSTPEFFGNVDRMIHNGWRRPNTVDDKYLNSDSAKRFSLGDMIFFEAVKNGTRLPDTVINGYHCRVVQIKQAGFTDTRWIWRGITLRQYFAPMDGGAFTVETVELTPNITFADSVFTLPAGYKIQELGENDPPPGVVGGRR
jgi:hypothetical protein